MTLSKELTRNIRRHKWNAREECSKKIVYLDAVWKGLQTKPHVGMERSPAWTVNVVEGREGLRES